MKKYGVEKANHQNVGRHYSKRDANRVTQQKIFDEYNDNYKEAKASWEEIIAWELQEQIEYNNELHPDQERFKGKTRLQVFLENVNPNLPKLNKGLLAQFIGNHTPTTITRSQYVTVQYQKYQLPNPQVLMMLAPNNYRVDAYYIPQGGEVKEVYLYQNGEYLCQCQPVPTFNRATAEWTDEDAKKYQEAMRYIQQFDQMVKQQTAEKLPRVGILESNTIPAETTYEIVENATPAMEYQYEEIPIEQQRNRALLDL